MSQYRVPMHRSSTHGEQMDRKRLSSVYACTYNPHARLGFGETRQITGAFLKYDVVNVADGFRTLVNEMISQHPTGMLSTSFWNSKPICNPSRTIGRFNLFASRLGIELTHFTRTQKSKYAPAVPMSRTMSTLRTM